MQTDKQSNARRDKKPSVYRKWMHLLVRSSSILLSDSRLILKAYHKLSSGTVEKPSVSLLKQRRVTSHRCSCQAYFTGSGERGSFVCSSILQATHSKEKTCPGGLRDYTHIQQIISEVLG